MPQGSLNVPVTGPDPPSNFAAEINTALDAVISKNNGASAPANFPMLAGGAPTPYQDWADSSPGAGIVDEREYDGSNWLRKGAQDQTAHVWMPIVGGGSGTIAAAATTDLGSVRQGYMTITGAIPGTPITAFGSNALLTTGETKFLRFTSAGIITHNATTLILPGAADLPFNTGDTLQALYLGAGNWLCYDFRSNTSRIGRNTGGVFEAWGTSTLPGAVVANGTTLGNGASGATGRANADTVNLFIFLYVNDTTLAVSGGRSGVGRANAIIDFNLNKTITLPNLTLRATLAKTTTALLTGTALPYNTPANCRELHIRMIAAGAGAGARTLNVAPTVGGDTIFNGIHAAGGSPGAAAGGTGGLGGTGGAGAAFLRIEGGGGSPAAGPVPASGAGGSGGNGFFGGAGKAGASGAGFNAKVNSGGGGGGAGEAGAGSGGSGGGAGEYVEIVITSPAASYTYTVGVKGTGGTAGGAAGGDGGDGIILVDEYSDFNLSHYLSL